MKRTKENKIALEALSVEQMAYCWQNKISVKKIQQMLQFLDLDEDCTSCPPKLVELLASLKTDPQMLDAPYDLKTKLTFIQYGVSAEKLADLEPLGLTPSNIAWGLRQGVSLIKIKRWLEADLSEPVIYRLLPLGISLESALSWLEIESNLDTIATLIASRMTPNEYAKWKTLPLSVSAMASFSLIRAPFERVRAALEEGTTCSEIWESEILKSDQNI